MATEKEQGGNKFDTHNDSAVLSEACSLQPQGLPYPIG